MSAKRSSYPSEIALLGQLERVESLGKDAQRELDFQQNLISTAQSNLNQTDNVIDYTLNDLTEIETREGVRWYQSCWQRCCCNRSSKGKRSTTIETPLEVITVEDHLSPQEVDRLWFKTYNPNERWFQQMEAQLDRLIELAELLDANIERQKAQAKAMNVQTDVIVNKVSRGRQKMKKIIE